MIANAEFSSPANLSAICLSNFGHSEPRRPFRSSKEKISFKTLQMWCIFDPFHRIFQQNQ